MRIVRLVGRAALPALATLVFSMACVADARAQLMWVQRSTLTSPPTQDRVAMAYDSARGQSMVFIPSQGASGLWELDGNGWLRRTPASGPTQVGQYVLAYDEARKRTVLLDNGANTWEWDGSAWTRPQISGAQGVFYSAMVYDAARKVCFNFGGYEYPYNLRYHSEAFTYDGATWKRVNDGPARAAHAMAYDSVRQRTVLFGGWNGVFPLGDTWEWDGTNWTQQTPAHSPPARYGHAMAFDSARGKVVLFGGYNAVELADTWEWDGTDWVEVKIAGPAARTNHAMTYDTARQRLVLFGGMSSFTPVHDTWEYYDVSQASFTAFGQACPGSAGLPTLRAAQGQLPRIGKMFVVQLLNLPTASNTFAYVGLSKTAWGPFVLPLDLGFVGMPKCTAYTSGNLLYSLPNLSGSATLTMTFVNDPLLLGLHFYIQGWVLDPPSNALGIVTSNAGEGVLGS